MQTDQLTPPFFWLGREAEAIPKRYSEFDNAARILLQNAVAAERINRLFRRPECPTSK